MANSNQSKKRARQAIRARQHNVRFNTKVHTFIKRTRQAVAAGDAAQAKIVFQDTESIIDKVVTKGILHPRTASRYKKRLAAQVKKLTNA